MMPGGVARVVSEIDRRSSIRLSVLLLLFLSILAVSANGQDPSFGHSLKKYEKKIERSDQKPDEVIRVSTQLVTADVMVVSAMGKPLVGFKKEDFEILENGIPQEISFFSQPQKADVGRSIILLIGFDIMLQPYIADSVAAAKVLIDRLGPKDRLAIVNDRIELLSPFSRDKDHLKQVLTSFQKNYRIGYRCKSVSAQNRSLLAGLNELIGKEDIRPVVIFQTNGDEYSNLRPMTKEWHDINEWARKLAPKCRNNEYDERPFSFEDVKDEIAEAGATVYSVIPGPRVLGAKPEDARDHARQWFDDMNRMFPRSGIITNPDGWRVDREVRWNETWQAAMADLASFSGGYTEFLENPKNAGRIYDDIFEIMNNRYLIGYYPKNDSTDSRPRTIAVKIQGHPEYRTIGRKAYIPRSIEH